MISLGAFPALIPTDEPLAPITGEVFQVTEAVLTNELDSLEGYPSFYNRKVVKSALGYDVWVYYFDEAEPYYGHDMLANGEW